MKQRGLKLNVKSFYTTCMLLFLQATAWAQDNLGSNTTETTKVEITTDAGNWFANNWMWLLGGLILLILLLSLAGGGSSYRRSRTVVREDPLTGTRTTTTTTDDDVV